MSEQSRAEQRAAYRARLLDKARAAQRERAKHRAAPGGCYICHGTGYERGYDGAICHACNSRPLDK